MKVQIRFKTPDAVRQAEEEALRVDELDDGDERPNPPWCEKMRAWFRHGEYVDLEYDTENDTMRVVKPPKERY